MTVRYSCAVFGLAGTPQVDIWVVAVFLMTEAAERERAMPVWV